MQENIKRRRSGARSTHVIAGVSLEKQVMAYLNDLALRMGMSRSWVLNTIVYEYAKIVEQKNLTPLVSRFSADPVIQDQHVLQAEQILPAERSKPWVIRA
jgi:hypothetical protein